MESRLDSPVSGTGQAYQVRNDNIVKSLLIHQTRGFTGPDGINHFPKKPFSDPGGDVLTRMSAIS